ncbi:MULTISPECIES: LysR family transcriptional regulator [unclassified Beijerinckia]|uniref:LysR family transcriptional regulator n=1 Tax=unclassified Beijerinckia TaxID=2638183 RepID=UPI00089C234F|nr:MULTISPECIES: LysR family transcriptional regulator [unclassified Beijerinckia]MDH7795394.1 DNA-binding transcriptional LysR family regulator [Beijerinckia sp. GAS462]SEB99773.1 DNA-binding transcriptional regulator, LysR family [Beijerinckia sp. 28-YEA-48]
MSEPTGLNRFDLTSLRLFVAVAAEGSLTLGAERFAISLAAASKRMLELEARVGTPLLTRSKSGVTATDAGQTLLRHAITLVADVEQLAVAMDDFRRGAKGHLRLWANTSAFAGFLPALLADYTAAHPAVMIDLEDALSEDAARAVTRGAAELAVIGANTPCDGLETFVCDRDELIVVARKERGFTRKSTVPLADVLRHDIVGLGRSTSLMRQISAAADAIGGELRLRIQVRSFDAMCRMVAAGIGIAILPRAGATPHLAAMGLHAHRLTGMKTQRDLLLAMRERKTLSRPAEAFVRMAEARMQ